MNKLKTIIDLVNQGDKAKLWKYLNKGIYSKKDKIDVVKSNMSQSEGGDGGGESANMVYVDLSQFSGAQGQQIKKMLIIFATDAVYKIIDDGELWYGPAAYARPAVDDVTSAERLLRLSFNLSQKLHMLIEFDDCNTVEEALAKINFYPPNAETANFFITEEEFYTI